jgi:hypothetical protein
MDPYLEARDVWPDVHQSLAVALREQLTPKLRPRYVALVHHEVEIEEFGGGHIPTKRLGIRRPDVSVVAVARRGTRRGGLAVAPAPLVLPLPGPREVKHFRLEVREVKRKRLVAVVEILSRANKVPGHDQESYESKAVTYLHGAAHFVEIDLLRVGKRWSLWSGERQAAYRFLVSRARARRNAEIWPIALSDPLPLVPLPLLRPDPDVPMDIGAALARVYEGAAYDLVIDYKAPPPPPKLSKAEASFVRKCTEGLFRSR